MDSMQNNSFGFDDAFLASEPYGKIGMVTNFPDLATLAPGIIAQLMIRIGGLVWRATDANGNYVNSCFQGYKAGYIYSIANLLGIAVTSNSVQAGTSANSASAFNTTPENANTIGSLQSVPVIRINTLAGQKVLLPIKPGVDGAALVPGMALYQKVPTAGMSWQDTVTHYAFSLGRPSDNTFVYSGYTINSNYTETSALMAANLGLLMECIATTYPNLTNNI